MRHSLKTIIAVYLLTFSLSLTSAARDIHQEDLAPVAEEYGVGHAAYWFAGTEYYRKSDGSDMAQYGSSLPSEPPFTVRYYRAWAIYDVSHFNPAIQVDELAVNSYVYPEVDAGHVTRYGRLTQDPRPASAAACWNILDGAVYAEAATPAAEGEMVTVLGEQANADFESAIKGNGLFMIRIEGNGDTSDIVWATGWQEARPRLTVVYEDPLATESATWGAIKALYRSTRTVPAAR